MNPTIERERARSGDNHVQMSGNGPFTLKKWTPASANGRPHPHTQRIDFEKDAPVLQTTVATLEEVERTLVAWCGVVYLDPNRP